MYRSISTAALYLSLCVSVTITALGMSSCSGLGSKQPLPDLGVTGRAVVYGPEGEGALPIALVAYDANTLVAWGDAKIQAELFLKVTGGDVVPPASVGAGKATVRNRAAGVDWSGDISAKQLPAIASMAFKPGEVERWGVTLVQAATD